MTSSSLPEDAPVVDMNTFLRDYLSHGEVRAFHSFKNFFQNLCFYSKLYYSKLFLFKTVFFSRKTEKYLKSAEKYCDRLLDSVTYKCEEKPIYKFSRYFSMFVSG